jgi:uncharacterized protein (TIGR02452 family)
MEAQLVTLQKTLALSRVKLIKNCITKRYKYEHDNIDEITPPITKFTVENRDAIEVALEMQNPLVMILADAHVPGGCIFGGANMQEESLFRRTALFAYLRKDDHYPIALDEALYAKDVQVFFDTEDRAFAPLTNKYLSFIACPGIKMPSLDNNGRMFSDDVEILTKQIQLIVQVAVKEGHTHIVAGALGCGVWDCPASHVAEIFRNVLLNSPLVQVKFAILGSLRHAFSKVFMAE